MTNHLPFCTCTHRSCKLHPANHDGGCSPCIEKNLKTGESPACYFNLLRHPEQRENDSILAYAKAVLEEAAEEPRQNGFVPKLVRDNIPQICAENGKNATVKALSEEAYAKALRMKLKEEAAEFMESGEVEELADILEVVQALSEQQNVSWDALLQIKTQKREERGGFDNRLMLTEWTDRE